MRSIWEGEVSVGLVNVPEAMAADFEPEKYENHYLNQLEELIEAKAAGGEAFTLAEREEASGDDGDDEVADLLAALRASVKGRGGDADASDDEGDEDDDENSDTGKKNEAKKSGSSSARKTPAKKAAAKKAPARKAAAKKSTSAKSDSGNSGSGTARKSSA